jgi:uncharacterized protein involved in exopolysaccharide biosynthesis
MNLKTMTRGDLTELLKEVKAELKNRDAQKDAEWKNLFNRLAQYISKYGEIPVLDNNTGELLTTLFVIDCGETGVIYVDREEDDIEW